MASEAIQTEDNVKEDRAEARQEPRVAQESRAPAAPRPRQDRPQGRPFQREGSARQDRPTGRPFRREGGPRRFRPRRKVCSFCVDKVQVIEYKKVDALRRFTDGHGKIIPRRKTGTCAKHQRRLALAIKRARHLALIPYTTGRSPYN